MKNDKFGYLASCITNIGSGMEFEMKLKGLTELIKYQDKLTIICEKLGL